MSKHWREQAKPNQYDTETGSKVRKSFKKNSFSAKPRKKKEGGADSPKKPHTIPPCRFLDAWLRWADENTSRKARVYT